MFQDIITYCKQSEDRFLAQVKDDFGASIDNEVYVPMIEQMYSLNEANEEAVEKMLLIQRKTEELRGII